MSAPDATSKKRAEPGAHSRQSILDAASQLMSVRGYDGTSISAIAKESGLPVSSIYWHFSSKLGILTAVIERDGARFRERTPLAGLPAGATRLERLNLLFDRTIEAVEANPDTVRLQLMIMLNSPAGVAKDAVMKARAKERTDLRAALTLALADLGEERASGIAADLTEFVGASFEGIFLAAQGNVPRMRPLLRRLAESTVALAEKLSADPVAADISPALSH